MNRAHGERFTCDCGVECVALPHWVSDEVAIIEFAFHPKGMVEIVSDMQGNEYYRTLSQIEAKARRKNGASFHRNHKGNCKRPRFVR